MPSKKQYDLVQNDDYDSRVPLHPDEAFHHGILFHVKYIGMLDVPRPTSRVEIIAAMRRIRYEFKAKGIKKKKVTVEVSVDGVKVTLRKKKKRKNLLDEDKTVLLSHPIYRIFYVSHDSQDLKVFSYIARDGASNVFKCVVFKSNKKSQAMRVVRTIGQSFEVCHKLSVTAPSAESIDQDEQDTLTQDLVSEQLSDITCDKPKKELTSEVDSDRASVSRDEGSTKESLDEKKNQRPPQLDLPPASSNMNSKKPSVMSTEMHTPPHADGMISTSVSGGSTSFPPPGTALSAHHEIQLLREQLEQQSQQTQAALAQLQLAREQLAAEQSARMEAQARTHQLLIHNRELLDHIAALVVHLQEGEKSSGHSQLLPHVAMPQQQQHQQHQHGQGDSSPQREHSDAVSMENGPILQAPIPVIENRAVTSALPHSPLRNSLNPTGTIFNFPHPLPEPSADAQLLQRLQTLIGYTPPQYSYGYNQNLPYLGTNLYNPSLISNNYSIQQQQQSAQNMPSPLSTYSGSPITERRFSPVRNVEQQLCQSQQSLNMLHVQNAQQQSSQSNYQQNYQQQQSQLNYQQQQQHQQQQQNLQNYQYQQQYQQQQQQQQQHQQQQHQNQQQKYSLHVQSQQDYDYIHGSKQNLQPPQSNTHLQVQQQQPPNQYSQKNDRNEPHFIKPLPQMGTLTTTDPDGNVRVIVPVPSNAGDEASNIFSSLRLTDELPLNGPGITRSTSEKVPNRSGLMSQVQRTAWARHTTK